MARFMNWQGRRAAPSLLLLAAVSLAGCGQQSGAETDVTLDGARTTVDEQMEALIAAIDPASIERIDDVTNDSFGCRGVDIDPDQRMRQWEVVQTVWLIDGVSKLDLVDQLVETRVDDGWTVASDSSIDGDGRRVRLHDPTSATTDERPGYVLTLGVGPGSNGQRAITISADSPCFDTPEE